jgi:hypothetical protein
MSMSTGDVRRPSLNKLVQKAAATDKPDPDVIDETLVEDDELLEEDDELLDEDEDPESAPPAKSTPAASKATAVKATPSKSAPSKSTPSKSTPSKATAAKATAAKAAPAKAARPTKSAAPARSGAKSGSGSSTASSSASSAATKSTARTGAPTTARTGGTTTKGARPAVRPTTGRGPVRAGGGKGRKPTAPIRVRQGRNWGPIAMFSIAGLLAIGIVAFGAVAVYRSEHKTPWQQRAAAIPGIHDYLASNPDWFKVPPEGNHKSGILSYPTSPPVGGIHNPQWQNCMGDVYDSQIAKEQATHSMEHGAVWVTYRPDLPKDQVEKLASKVRNKPFMLMSPYPGLDKPISLQAWGYQLKVDNANDGRIDDFIDALRLNATQEPQAGCSNGITDATPTPLDMAPLPTA